MDKDINLKKAPQQEVLSIEKTGSWGNFQYRHRLTCGHTEVRKRPTAAAKIACSWCVVAEDKKQELAVLATTPAADMLEVPLELAVYDPDLAGEVDAGLLKAGLVARLGCPPEAVETVMEVGEDGVLAVSYVVVYLDARMARRLAGVDNPTNP